MNMQGMLASAVKPQAPQQPQGQPQAPMQGQPPAEGGSAYDQAMGLVREALYSKEAARDVAKAMKVAGDPAQGLADTAYEMVTIADEGTQGQVPDEELVSLATEVLGEVADIATAAGIEVKGATIAKAMQMMLVRYVTEQGLDPTQLQQAMAQVNPDELGAKLDQEV
jgi:hypothetical protein